jgi:hypothetical protein
MIDQIKIGDRGSYDDFGASLAKPIKKNPPKKKSIKESVPFSNITHDFSAINGEVYWEEREIECVFEMVAPTPERLEEMRVAFSAWVMNVSNEKIHDPFNPNFHYIGTYEDMSFADEDSGEKTTATVKFTAYPYMRANLPRRYEFEVDAKGMPIVFVPNGSSHPVAPVITVNGDITIDANNIVVDLKAGTYQDSKLSLPMGTTQMTLVNKGSTKVNVTIDVYEEVF